MHKIKGGENTQKKIIILTISFILAIIICGAATAANNTTELITPGSSGIGGNQASYGTPSINNDGNIIVFSSTATDLVQGLTTNGNRQIYVYDRNTHTTSLITAGPSGTGGNAFSYYPAISSDGNILTFQSEATDLINGFTPVSGRAQIYVYDRTTQTTTLITKGTGGTGGTHDSYMPAISDDGNIITFSSFAKDLIQGITPIGFRQVYAYDRNTQTTTLISRGSGNGGNLFSYEPSISGNGNIITFHSSSNNLINGITTTGIQIFTYYRDTQITILITPGSAGTGANQYSYNPEISKNGNIITFYSFATDLINGLTPNGNPQIYVYDRNTQTTTIITPGANGNGGNGNSEEPTINGDGNIITFQSTATDLIPGTATTNGWDIFAYNRNTQTTTLITPGANGNGGNEASYHPSVNSDGNIITFQSMATDLIPGITTNGQYQIFAYVVHEVDPDDDPSNDPTAIQQVKAATNTKTTGTIGMQETGAPLLGIILAILLILGGFINTWKNQ